ncbi:MAG: hypothetical protein CMB11_08130 [Euryarchaeota archaeon]|nr:hypothetical protein [Euryarchaeota archaeon]|tara:strand:- start:469 stop:2163 length:1695 start_codon:yes stop_codon:yes gene_type:complete
MLPTLSQLRLGDATGVTLDLVSRPKGKASDDSVASGKRQALREIENPVTLSTIDPKPALQALVKAFRTSGSAERAQWKAAVNETMDRKIERYKERLGALQRQIVVEHKGVQEFIAAADENLKDRATSRSGKAGQAQSFAKDADEWELAQEVNGLWKKLLMEKAALQRLEEAAKTRKEGLSSGWDEKCEALADAIEQPMLDFPNQVTLLETFRQLITGFLKNSATAEDYQTNYILMGNAGVGKTRIARLIGELLGKLGIFVFDDYLEVARADFVAQYEGQTAPKTRALLVSSVERVIFLDEAYSLTTYDKKENPPVLNTYSAEAISEILTFLSDNVGCSCFIAAGYENQMMNDFLEANEGLDRRFNQKIWLDDYEPEDLLRIYLTGLAESLGLGRDDGKTLFTSAALRYFEAIFAERTKRKDAGEYEYPVLERMFRAQAGAALTLVSETKLLLFSAQGDSEFGANKNGKPTYAIGPEDVKKIFESRMEKSIRQPEDGVWELIQIAACCGVFSAETNRWKLVIDPKDGSSSTCDFEHGEIGTKRRAKPPERLSAASLRGPATVPYT